MSSFRQSWSVRVSVGSCEMERRRTALFAIAVAAIVLFFFVYMHLLPNYSSPGEDTTLSAFGGIHILSSESQRTPQTSRQHSTGQPRLELASQWVSTDRNRANKTGYLLALDKDAHAQSRQMPRNQWQINSTAHQNGAIRPPTPLNQQDIGLQSKVAKQKNAKPKPNRSLCTPRKVSNATAFGFQPLSKSVAEGVEKFVFFVGYARSGHSMIGGVMDAHPDIVISSQYFLLSKCAAQLKVGNNIFDDKTRLFNTIYKMSYLSSKCGLRSANNMQKGYTLNVEGQWQGTFRQLRVIGDQACNQTVNFLVKSGKAHKCLEQMVDGLHMSIIPIHVVRNPYDIIATNILYKLSTVKRTKASDVLHRKVRSDLDMQLSFTSKLFSLALAVTVVSKKFTVVEIHIEDYIKDPRHCVLEICNALEVPCPQDYVEGCYQKAYRNVSRTRDLIEWEPEVLRDIQERMKEFPFFQGYTFEDDFRL